MAKLPATTELTDTVVRILATELKVRESQVRCALSLKADVGMDSIAAANIVFELEDAYDIEIELGEADSLDTVDEIVVLLRRRIEAP